MAVLAMNAYLMAVGYPMVLPEMIDRQLLVRVIGGPKPRRIVRLEGRLLDFAEELRPAG